MSRSGTISFSEHKERIMWINWPDINTSLTPAPQMGGPAKVHTLPCRTCSPPPPFWSNTFFSEFPHKKDNKIVSKTFQLSKILWHITVNSKNIKTDISCPHFNWRIGEKFISTFSIAHPWLLRRYLACRKHNTNAGASPDTQIDRHYIQRADKQFISGESGKFWLSTSPHHTRVAVMGAVTKS